jgi:hypothetical protein
MDDVGGGWAVESVRFPDSHDFSCTLYHRQIHRQVRVAELVHQYKYYGDDCIVYGHSREGHEEYFMACGNRRPYPIGSASDWVLGTDRVREYDPLGGSALGRTISIRDLKKLAASQPPL